MSFTRVSDINPSNETFFIHRFELIRKKIDYGLKLCPQDERYINCFPRLRSRLYNKPPAIYERLKRGEAKGGRNKKNYEELRIIFSLLQHPQHPRNIGLLCVQNPFSYPLQG